MLLLVTVGVVILIRLLRPRILKRQLTRMLAEGKNAGLYGQHRLIISPDGIREVLNVGEPMRRWKAVEKIGVTDDHAFFYITALSAFVLPRRGCSDELHFQQFVRSAQMWMAEAQASGPAER
jgi:hypothetical protein